MKLWKQRQQDKLIHSNDQQTAMAGPSDLRRPPFGHFNGMAKSSSRTSLDIQGRINNFMQKSTSTSSLNAKNVDYHHSNNTADKRFPRPGTASTSNVSDPSVSPGRLLQPRKWVNNLLHSNGANAEHLETTAQARKRASVDLSRPSPAFVSSLVLSDHNAPDHSPLVTRPLYTLDTGLRRNEARAARPASVYSSHLSSASRSNPELHRGSVTRHLDNGAMVMDIAPTLASLATTSSRLEAAPSGSSRLEVRNIAAGSPESSTLSLPLPSHIAERQGHSNQSRYTTSPNFANRSEEEDEIDASIARDREHNLLGREEQAVLNMLTSSSSVPWTASDQQKASPLLSKVDDAVAYPSPNTSAMSPKISSLLQSLSVHTDTRAMQSSVPKKSVSRVPVPALDLAAPSTTTADVVSPSQSSMPSSTALDASLWSRPLQSPDTLSSPQDLYSPLRSASSVPSKWSASNSYFNLNQVGKTSGNKATYGVEEISSPVTQTNANVATRTPPQLIRHTTDFTVASSVSESVSSLRSPHKQVQADKTQPVTTVSRASSTRSTGSSLAAIKNELEKAASGSRRELSNDGTSSVRSVGAYSVSRPSTPSKIVMPASPTKAKDLIKMFETNSATASPSERSAFFSPADTPRKSLSPSKELDTQMTGLNLTPKRHMPLAPSVSRSNVSATSSVTRSHANTNGSPMNSKAEWRGSHLHNDTHEDAENESPGLSMQYNQRANAFLKPTLTSTLVKRRQSAQSDHEDRVSTASDTSQGSKTSYRHQKESGDLPLNNSTAILLSGAPAGSRTIRAGPLLYYNGHDSDPRWLSVNATLLPGAIAMSWIPAGGGRENVVLDLAACREVHSVPSPDHPSSATDIGAVSARRQALEYICPFQLIFDDGVERLAADSIKSRLQWVNSFREVTGTASPRYGSVADTFTVNSRQGPSFGQAVSSQGSLPPPLPPKDVQDKQESALKPTLLSTPFTTTSTVSSGQVRAKVQDWQRSKENANTDSAHASVYKSPLLNSSLAELARSTPGSYADARSRLGSSTDDHSRPGVYLDSALRQTPLSREPSLDANTPIDSTADMDGYESALSHNSVSDEFGPRTPASEVVFNWDRLDKESDLDPSDSASQRPTRSEYGTIRSNASYEHTPNVREILYKSATSAVDRTPAQMLRDSVLDTTVVVPVVITDEDDAGQSERLGTVLEETSSQARSASVYNSFRSSPDRKTKAVEYRNVAISKRSPDAKSVVSHASDSSFNSQDVGKLLEYLDIQEREKLTRDHRLENQVRQFQRTVSKLQEQGSARRSAQRRYSAGSLGGESRLSAHSYHNSELSAMQEKLDKVLDLVTKVVADPQAKHLRGQSEPASGDVANTGSGAETAETARVEAILAKILRNMQRTEDSIRLSADGRAASSKGLLPVVPMLNVTPAEGTVMSKAPTDASHYSRMTPRSWTSDRGIPATPPNSEWEARSTSSLPVQNSAAGHAISGRGPNQDIRMLGDTHLSSATPRQVLIGSERSCGSVDMEAEVRRRRAHHRESSGALVSPSQAGGWYTLKGDAPLDPENAVAPSSIVDKPVPPTPGVRWAMDDDALPAKDESDQEARVSMSAVEQAQTALPLVTAAPHRHFETVLQSLRQNEVARQIEMRQQTEISRYLNELNVWLEKDVADRSKEWKSMVHGVTQLHEELKMLKEGVAPIPTTANATASDAPIAALASASDAGNAVQSDAHKDTSVTAAVASKRGSLPPIPRSGGKSVAFADTVTVARADSAGLEKTNQPVDKSKWIHNHDLPTVLGNLKTAKSNTSNVKDKAAEQQVKAKAAAEEGAALVRSALCELDKFRAMQRAEGKAETPLPAAANGDAAAAAKLKLPEPMWVKVKEAADKNDHTAVAESIRECATGGYGAQAVVKLADHVESKGKADATAASDETSAKEDDGMQSMQTPVPRSYKLKEKEADITAAESDAVTTANVGDSGGPSPSALASAVEEILKHLLEQKKQQAEADAQRKAADEAREQALVALKEQEKAELVNMIYSKMTEVKAAEDAAREAKAKEMDPKTAIEMLVEAINNQKMDEIKSQQAADVAIRQMTSELLKSTTEQNQKMVEAVNAASRDMLRSNVQMHAEEFKRILHKEVTGMFEDVGKIREAKRHLEFEIADLWSIKSRHLQQAATSGLPITYSVPGDFPSTSPQKPFAQPPPTRAQIQHSQPGPFPPGNIQSIPAHPPAKAAKPAPTPSPAPSPPKPSTPVQTLGNLSPSKHHPFTAFGPRQPLYR